MDTEQFCKRLRSPSVGQQFSRFLRVLRESKGWGTQQAMQSDPKVVAVCSRTGIKPAFFPRILDRTIAKGRTSPANLLRFAAIFDEGTADDFVSAFNTWCDTEGPSGQRPLESQFALDAASGKYVLQKNTRLIGARGEYIIKEGKGLETRGDSYKAIVSGTRDFAFVKTLSLSASMTAEELDARIHRFNEFFEREQWSLEALAGVEGVARFRDYGLVHLHRQGERVRLVRFLVQQFVQGETLELAMGGTFSGVVNGKLWIDMARQLLRILSDIHNKGVHHGDVRPDNILLSGDRLVLVDFGQSGMLSPDADRNESAARNPYAAPERRTDWTIPLEAAEDLYSMGCVLFWLASGKPPPVPAIEDNHELRTTVEAQIRPELLKYNEGILHVICGLLHYKRRDRTAHAADALRTLELFETIAGHPSDRTVVSLADEAKALVRAVEVLPTGLFAEMMRHDLAFLLRRTAEMAAAGRAQVTGTRDEIISSLLNYLSIMRPGDQYVTTTSIGFWSEANLGLRGRFLCANKLLALRGGCVRRIFIVTKSELATAEFRAVAKAQADVMRELSDLGVETAERSLDGRGMFIGVIEVDDEEAQRKILKDGWHIALIRTVDQELSLSFEEDNRDLVRKIYVWNVRGRAVLRHKLDETARQLHDAKPVTSYA